MTLTNLHLVSEANLGSSEQTLSSDIQGHSLVALGSILGQKGDTVHSPQYGMAPSLGRQQLCPEEAELPNPHCY